VYFDNRHHTIGPDHIRASGSLPPGFPPVTIDGEVPPASLHPFQSHLAAPS